MSGEKVAPPAARSFPTFSAPRRSRALVILLVAALVAVAAVGLLRRRVVPVPSRYLTSTVTRGPLREVIRATGAVEPLSQVQVGAQVSGRVVGVSADYNSTVRAGEMLAQIDPIPYRAQVAQARAALMSARAQLVQSRVNENLALRILARQGRLREQGVSAPADLDAAEASAAAGQAAIGVAEAAVGQARAALIVSEANLEYTRVVSPIDGIVALRSIEPGQTVAASFQTPTLFVIANDLIHMRVIANVDEADIGKLNEGMTVTARVDAFPRETFAGVLQQLRISPTTTNGVVTYQAVIDVLNARSRLRPGMTATVSVVTAERQDILRVPSAALRYRAAADVPPPSGGSSAEEAPGEDDSTTVGDVYIVSGEAAVRVRVTIGLTDGAQTEINGPGVRMGAQVVLDEVDSMPKGRPPGPRMF